MKQKGLKEVSSFQVFNMSVATLERINTLLQELHTNWIEGNVLIIQRLLFALYKEIYPFLNAKEREIGDNISEKIRENMGFDNSTGSHTYSNGISLIFNDLDFWLRDKLNEKGLLMAMSDNKDKAYSMM